MYLNKKQERIKKNMGLKEKIEHLSNLIKMERKEGFEHYLLFKTLVKSTVSASSILKVLKKYSIK